MHSRTILYTNFSAAEHANFLAAKVVAAATGYLDDRQTADQLGRASHALMCELIAAPDDDAGAKQILTAARLLVISMGGASRAENEARLDRWQQVMGSLVELVRHESREIKDGVMRR